MMDSHAYALGGRTVLSRLGLLKKANTDSLINQAKNYLPKSKTGKGALIGATIGTGYGLHRLMSDNDDNKSPQRLPSNYKIKRSIQ